jgi:hypothetical protein
MSKKEELEALKLELKNRTEARQAKFDSAHSEVDKMAARLGAFQRNLVKQQGLLEAMQNQAAAEIKKLEATPKSPRRDHNIYLYTIRREVSARQIEFIRLMSNFNPTSMESIKAFQANQARLDILKVESLFLGQEYTVVNYRPVANAIEEFLGNPASGAPARPATGSLGGGQQPGRLQQARGGTGPLSAAQPPRPGVARPPAGQGPLAARSQAQGTPQRTGTGPLSGGTGPLNGGTGRLSAARGAAPAEGGPHRVLVLLREGNVGAEQQRHLQMVVQQFKEIDEQMNVLRGPTPASLAVSHEQASDMLNKVNGKIYYLKRTLSNLGPLGDQLAFEPEETDAAWDEFVTRQSVNADGAEADVEEKVAQGLTGKLKSFFNLG